MKNRLNPLPTLFLLQATVAACQQSHKMNESVEKIPMNRVDNDVIQEVCTLVADGDFENLREANRQIKAQTLFSLHSSTERRRFVKIDLGKMVEELSIKTPLVGPFSEKEWQKAERHIDAWLKAILKNSNLEGKGDAPLHVHYEGVTNENRELMKLLDKYKPHSIKISSKRNHPIFYRGWVPFFDEWLGSQNTISYLNLDISLSCTLVSTACWGKMKQLRELHLSPYMWLSSEDIAAISNLTRLTHLSFGAGHSTIFKAESIKSLANLPELKWLQIRVDSLADNKSILKALTFVQQPKDLHLDLRVMKYYKYMTSNQKEIVRDLCQIKNLTHLVLPFSAEEEILKPLRDVNPSLRIEPNS